LSLQVCSGSQGTKVLSSSLRRRILIVAARSPGATILELRQNVLMGSDGQAFANDRRLLSLEGHPILTWLGQICQPGQRNWTAQTNWMGAEALPKGK
jgi:hypothetical protein